MDQTLKRHTITFIVRIWAEYLEQSPPQCRGEIERLDKPEKAHFFRWQQIPAVIRHSLTSKNPPKPVSDHPSAKPAICTTKEEK